MFKGTCPWAACSRLAILLKADFPRKSFSSPSGTFSREPTPIPDEGLPVSCLEQASQERAKWDQAWPGPLEPAFECLLLTVTQARLCPSLITEHLLCARSVSSLVTSGPHHPHLAKEVNIPALQSNCDTSNEIINVEGPLTMPALGWKVRHYQGILCLKTSPLITLFSSPVKHKGGSSSSNKMQSKVLVLTTSCWKKVSLLA